LGDDEAVLFADAAHPTHAARPAGCWAPKQEKLGEGVNVSTGISVDGFELTRLNEAGQLSGAFADLGPRTCQCEFGQGAGRVRLGQTQCAFRCPCPCVGADKEHGQILQAGVVADQQDASNAVTDIAN
jgi:hypothetical protein